MLEGDYINFSDDRSQQCSHLRKQNATECLRRNKISYEMIFLPSRVGVFTHSENSEKGPIPESFLAATANWRMLLNSSCSLNVHIVDCLAIFRFTNDSESVSGLPEQMIYWVIWDPPSLSGAVQSIVTFLSPSMLTTGRPGLPGSLISIEIHTHTWITKNTYMQACIGQR